MEKIIFRKFLFDLMSFFFIVSLSLAIITWVIQSVNYLDFISKDGHGFKVYFAFISLNFPKIYSKLIIFSYFVSLFFTIQKYKSNNEILIFWTNGISRLKLINFVIKVSVVFTIIQILFVFFLVPKTQDYSRDFIRQSNIDLFSSLISEKKFIDTVKDFTIFIDSIDENGNMENIYLKDSIDKISTQIITARGGKIIEKENEKYLYLNYGQILDISNKDFNDTKVIKFNNFTFNISKFKTKSTTFPKLQEVESTILIQCIKNFYLGKKINYSLPFFHCTDITSIRSAKEIFDRSAKQFYLIILGIIGSLLVFINDNNPKNLIHKTLIFSIGLILIVLSEISSELLNISILNNLFFIFTPVFIFIIAYSIVINLNNKIL